MNKLKIHSINNLSDGPKKFGERNPVAVHASYEPVVNLEFFKENKDYLAFVYALENSNVDVGDSVFELLGDQVSCVTRKNGFNTVEFVAFFKELIENTERLVSELKELGG